MYLTNAKSSDPKVLCPEFPIVSEVRYRTAEVEIDPPPPPGKEEKEEGGEEEGEGSPTAPGESGPPGAVPLGFGPAPAALPGAVPDLAKPYWLRCRRGVRTHLVPCPRALRIGRRAASRLVRPGRARIAGFACRRSRVPTRPISCRRGPRRVLARA
jgi:hypothetical protein